MVITTSTSLTAQERRIKHLTLWKLRCGNFVTGHFPLISTVIEEFSRHSKMRFKTLPKKLGVFHKGYEISREHLEDFEYCIKLGSAEHFVVRQNPKSGEITNDDYWLCFKESKGVIKAFGELDDSFEVVDIGGEGKKVCRLLGWC